MLSACESGSGSNPITRGADTDEEPDTGGGGGDEETPGEGPGDPIDSDRELPPGTESPSPATGIFRKEALDVDEGNGFARNIEYRAADDTFFVDGLAFDGNQPEGEAFARSTPGSLRPSFALYEAPLTHPDFLDNDPISQFEHRALYGVSGSGDVEFAIVRTGAYIGYGFGGWVYQRNGTVTLPTEGQASYSGDYGAIRDFDGRGGLEYASGDMVVDIDFNGFRGNCSGEACANAVRGYVLNRSIFDTAGNDITSDYIDAINDDKGTTLTELPVLRFRIGPGVADENGELTGEAFNTVDGDEFMTGNYYAVMSGDHTAAPGGEIVGVIVVEGLDPRGTNITVRETGGFIVSR
ncbi:hypothetical protein [Roseivivax lentus]|nr:hypothetical protein [Roseivivax lentus]